jgi:hypothetical protein
MAPTENVPIWENDLARTILSLESFSQTELSFIFMKEEENACWDLADIWDGKL